jgi:hypothetical protein
MMIIIIVLVDSEENSDMNKLSTTLEGSKLVNLDPILRTDNPNYTENEAIPSIDTDTAILRLRGGAGEEEKERQTVEETVGERFILTTLDEEESEAIGGRMEDAKLPGMICISGCNPNGIKARQLKSHL